MIKLILASAAVAAFAVPAQAVTVTQWNFNSTVADGNTGTGVTTPAIGSGTASLVGGVTATFASGDANGGSSDPATGDDSGWNTTTYAAAGMGDKTRGVQFAASTAGFTNIVIGYDLRHSNTSSQFEQVQVTTNGSTFVDVATFSGNAGDTWFNARTVDLTGVAGVANNASFAFRVLSTFAPGGTDYVASAAGSSYGSAGTWRFDMATVSGVSAVPEPGTYLLLIAGLAAIGLVVRRRSAD